MSSYDMDGSPAPDGPRDVDSKKIRFRFCRECSNMLYPKEDHLNNMLMFACRTCPFKEEAGASCVYRNSLKETIMETPGNVQDVAQDPTVGEDTHMSYDYVYDSGEEMEDAEGMDVVPEMCTLCGQEILCPICEQPTDGGIMLEAEDPESEVQRKGEEVVRQEQRERSKSGAGITTS